MIGPSEGNQSHPPSVAKWLGRQSYLDDLASLDPELYKGLVQLKNYPGNPEDLSLNFTVAEEEFGVTRSIDLVPGGADIAVTRLNRMECEFVAVEDVSQR